jgi:hypothetical protein
MNKKVTLAIVPLLTIGPALAQTPWVTANLSHGDQLVCERTRENETFFVALNGNRLKLGYLIDVDRYKESHAFLAAWRILDERGEVGIAQIPPQPTKDQSVRLDGKNFVEGIEYQTIADPMPRKLQVSVGIKKCSSVDCSWERKSASGENEYRQDLCAVELKP